MILTYKYKLKGKRAARRLRRLAWAVNQVWNYCVLTQKKTQRNYKEGLSAPWKTCFDLNLLTSGVSKNLFIHSQTIQSICKQFIISRNTHKKCPKFRKSTGSKKSLGWIPFQGQSRTITHTSITYAKKVYALFGTNSRPLPLNAKGGAFIEDARGNWYATFHVEVERLPKAPTALIGIDLGLKTLATLSNGEKLENPRFFQNLQKKLAISQRAGNKKRIKAIHAKIKNSRADYLHKASNKLASNFSHIVVGDVSSSKLAKTPMAKSVLDAGWSPLKKFLRYKVSRHGGVFLEVDEKFTSQICSACGDLPASRPKGIADLGIREWDCSSCGAHLDRDVNAAKNILNLGCGFAPPVEEILESALLVSSLLINHN